MASPAKQHRAEGAASPKTGGTGGTGKSTGKLVGADNFVRHNPRSDKFVMTDFDHIEVWCADAFAAARSFGIAFGLQEVARTNIDNGNFLYTSIVMQSETIRFVFTAPYWTDAPKSNLAWANPFESYDRDAAFAFIKKHGLAVKAVGIQVASAKDAFDAVVKSAGAEYAVTKPTTIKDDLGTMVYSETTYYEHIKFRWIEGRSTYKGGFMPGYTTTPYNPAKGYGLRRVDHIVSNVPCLTDITDQLIKMLGFHEFGEFTAEDVGTVDSGLNSMVMANNDETVLLPVNEPTFGTRRKSQIQSYLEHNRGPGIQHIAISTTDIISTIEKMTNAHCGVEFMPNPGERYYKDHVPHKMGTMVSQDLIDRCQKFGILIDRDDEGGLLQIFTKPLPDRPTLFVEIIQRVGCMVGEKQKPACGGFGKGNFGALFKSIEDWEKERDGEK